MDYTNLPKKIKQHLDKHLQPEDPQAKVIIKRSSLGWLRLKVITSCFANKSLVEREEQIDSWLEGLDFHLSKYPMSGHELLTPQEAEKQPPEFIQLPLWSDILMAPDPDRPVTIDEDSSKRPLVVTFYSFKGGVGRSTALGLVGTILASHKNRKVVMVDFDLEAPGISVLFAPDLDNNPVEQDGVLDYLHQRHLTPEENIPPIEDCINQVNLPGRGALFLVPVGEYNENYIHRLADLNRGTLQYFYRRETNPVEQLIQELTTQLNPDVILIDCHSGFNDTSAIALFDLADTAIICFSPTDQSFQGLRWVVQAANIQKDYQGKPELRFLLTPMPAVPDEQRQIWLKKVEEWIEDNYILPRGTTASKIYHEVFYNPKILTLSSLVNTPNSLLNDYEPIANMIDASLPDIKPRISSTIG